MKKFNRILSITALSVSLSAFSMTVLSGCSAALHSAASSNDGMYGVHDKVQIANRQREAAELRRAEAEARRAELEARIAEAQVRALEDDYYDYPSGTSSYSSILADTYESAYMRRLQGFNSSTYRMPSSYYNLRYSSDFTYATAYDPAFYNIMVSGNQVWVEPKYISSMFGTWGATNVTFGVSFYPYSWYYGWNRPYYYGSWWGFPHYSWFDWNWGICYNPNHWWGYGYGWGPSWGHGWQYGWNHGWRPGGYHPSYGPSRPQPPRQNIVSGGRTPTRYQSPSSGKNYGSGGSGSNRGTINGSGTFRPNNSGGSTSRPGNSGTPTRNNRNNTNNNSDSYNNSNRGGSSSFFNNNNSGGSRSQSQGSGSFNGGSSGGSRGSSSGGGGGRGNSIGR